MKEWRSCTYALAESARVFVADPRKRAAPDKMKETLDAMAAQDLPQPRAFKAMHFRASMVDHARFNQVEDMLALCSLSSGPLQDMPMDAVVEQMIIEVLSDVFQQLVQTLHDPISDEDKGTLDCMATLSGKLAVAGNLPEAKEDLNTIARLCRSRCVE